MTRLCAHNVALYCFARPSTLRIHIYTSTHSTSLQVRAQLYYNAYAISPSITLHFDTLSDCGLRFDSSTMNYHKLFSRFYNAGEQQNSAELQRCDNFSGSLPPDESKGPEVGDDIHVDFEYEQRHEEETLVCEMDNSNMAWETSARDQVPVTVEPISSEQVSISHTKQIYRFNTKMKYFKYFKSLISRLNIKLVQLSRL